MSPASSVPAAVPRRTSARRKKPTVGAADAFCATVNDVTKTSPWPFLDKSNSTSFLPGEFYEGGINLSTLGLGDKCFSSVASETRSSTSTPQSCARAADWMRAAGGDEFRTAPLWGLHIKSRFMHDLESLTLHDAIVRHKGEAAHVTRRFLGLTPAQQEQRAEGGEAQQDEDDQVVVAALDGVDDHGRK